MAQYNEKIGEFVPDNLIYSGDVDIVTGSVVVASGAGKLERGTVLAMSSGTAGTGKCVVLGATAATNETLTAYGIVCDELDATSADAVAEVYLAGHFNKNALKMKNGATLTAADIKALRDGGIFISTAMN